MQQPTSNFETFTFHKKDEKPQVKTSNPTPHSNSTNLLQLHSMSSRPNSYMKLSTFNAFSNLNVRTLEMNNPWI
jgi:hypothetical protein